MAKRALYVGINSYGSTSKMRLDKLRLLLPDWEIDVIDTDIPYNSRGRILKHLAFCYKVGPLISIINKYIVDNLKYDWYDLIWTDKAIFLTPETTKFLRERTDLLVHYTPDPAFTFHKSKIFYRSIPLYDFMITTKSYEIEEYVKNIKSKDKVLYVTQGFDKNIHRPIINWEDKSGVAFIGHHEVEREIPIKALLEENIDVYLAGNNWEKFAKKHRSNHLHYLGVSIQGEEYVKGLNNAMFALGSVSKWIPEKHTTRTFEIPACKTALLTEWNEEIGSFYSNDDVIFYKDVKDLIKKVKYFSSHPQELKELVENGYEKVQTGGFDFESIIRNLLLKVLPEEDKKYIADSK